MSAASRLDKMLGRPRGTETGGRCLPCFMLAHVRCDRGPCACPCRLLNRPEPEAA